MKRLRETNFYPCGKAKIFKVSIFFPDPIFLPEQPRGWKQKIMVISLIFKKINKRSYKSRDSSTNHIRAWVSTGAAGAWHPPKFWTSPLAPADFEVLNTNWHPQSSFCVTSGTLSFKFLTQALLIEINQNSYANSDSVSALIVCNMLDLARIWNQIVPKTQ